jgi:hypothetical protein
MKIALIPLSSFNTPVEDIFSNLHGYWTPPSYVLSFWSSGCQIEYINDIDYEQKKREIQESHEKCVRQHYMDNAL